MNMPVNSPMVSITRRVPAGIDSVTYNDIIKEKVVTL